MLDLAAFTIAAVAFVVHLYLFSRVRAVPSKRSKLYTATIVQDASYNPGGQHTSILKAQSSFNTFNNDDVTGRRLSR